MSETEAPSFVLFVGTHRLVRGSLADVARAARASRHVSEARLAIYNERTGSPLDLDLEGTEAEVLGRLPSGAAGASAGATAPSKRGRGRPKLGVVSREVSLLPRHWDWLAEQPGSASAALRRLVDAARATNAPDAKRRQAVSAAHRFLWDAAGDHPGFEEASRALFRHEFETFAERIADWPEDIRDQGLFFLREVREDATD